MARTDGSASRKTHMPQHNKKQPQWIPLPQGVPPTEVPKGERLRTTYPEHQKARIGYEARHGHHCSKQANSNADDDNRDKV